jgi:hypothetical protein
MIETKDIKKMVAHIVRRDKGIADTNIMHPSRDWFTGLGITVLIVAIGTWFSFYLYASYQTKMSQEVVIIESVVPYNATVVSSALELFALKQDTYNKILSGGKSGVQVEFETSTTTPEAIIVPIEPETEVDEDIPELIIDPPPIFEDEEVITPTLAL